MEGNLAIAERTDLGWGYRGFPITASSLGAVMGVAPGCTPGATCHVFDNLICDQKGMTVTIGKRRESTSTPPDLPSGIIPARSDGETRNAALFDLRLCASLLIIVLLLLVGVILAVRVQPRPGMDALGPWLFAGCLVVSVLGWSRRSQLRVVRLRHS